MTKYTTDPVITITLPVAGIYSDAPAYDITITEANLDQYWYTLNGGSPIYITSTTDTINSTEWGNLPDGSVEIMFYANDDADNEGSNSVTVTKDTRDPVILIATPISGVYSDASAYDITITEANLDRYWYTLNGGSPIYITSTTGTINSTEWGILPDGSVEIIFYANDDAGNEGSNSVTVTKDTTNPVITIMLPVADIYSDAPAYDITITEVNLDQYWYTLNGGSYFFITSTPGTIDSTEWDNLPDGSVEIIFYANDTAGNEDSNSVTVTKDTTDPVITITAPLAGVYNGAPAYDITITEAYLDQYWYTLNGGSSIYITSTTGTINSTEWGNLPDGSVEIMFYANDTAGNEGSNSITVTKDTTDPVITITTPLVGVYNGAPAYDITIAEANLNQYWYTLNGGSYIFIISTIGTIDSTEWGNLPDGSVEIFFYANDTAGNEGSNSVTVNKDTTDPVITITLPVVGVYSDAPTYDITMTEANLDQYWYTLNGGSPNYITSTTGNINSTEWGNLPDGSVEIIFYANDDADNEGSISVTVTKDATDPIITIIAPLAGVYSGAPTYDITITEANLDQYWYTLNGGSPIYITSTTGNINSTEWGNLPDGSVEIIFYANDIAGNEGSSSVTVTKDTAGPIITITAPLAGVYNGAPAYDITVITVTGDNLDQYWYTLNGGSPIYITSTTGTINSTEWDTLPDGSIVIIFYANDTAGNEGSNSVTVTKDTTDPVILITTPIPGVYSDAPAYDITITEANLDQYWYTLNGGSTIYITSMTGTINSTEWGNLPDGSVEIMFYANDTTGNEDSNSVTVTKDTTDPVILITTPISGVYSDAPAYDITITEDNLDRYWYTLNGGSPIYITSMTGTINSTEWGNLPDGSVEIMFYANDDAGNEDFNSVTVTKDTTDPVINITLPVADVYSDASAYDITITEVNLDRYWYTLNGGSPIYITSTTGTINSTEWGILPDGSVEIMFYANDAAANEGSNSVTVTKDTTDPVITIMLPVAGIYSDAPAYDITITEANLDQYWYTLNGGSYFFITSTTGTIDSTEWGNLPDGSVEIIFYANDTAGNEDSNSVTVTKDTTDPFITITLPVAGVYSDAPAYDITITEDNLDQYWYTLNGGSSIYITSTTGTINSTEWGSLPDGSVEIIFYANDDAGNEGSSSVTVTKDATDSIITITTPLAGVYSGAPTYDITITEPNLDQYWYALNGGSPIYITSTTGTINSIEWSTLPDGSVVIIFYANDTAGNEGSNSVTVTKDTMDPVINITLPLADVYSDASAYDITIIEDNLDQYWYTLNGGSPIYITSTTGTINSTEWGNLPDDSVEIMFYANDTAGNEGSNSITVTKDTTDPVITIMLPVVDVYNGAPAYDITITEANLNQYWYTLNGGSPIYITSTTGTINSTEWGTLPDGSVEIIFYANDDADNEGSSSVTVAKDTTDPVITITIPVVGIYNGAPAYDITITEINLDQYWYTLNGGSPIYIISTTGTINPTEWSNLPDGSVEIIFYANDTAGNEGLNSVTVTKDTTDPVILITTPVAGVYSDAPAYDITITEDNLDRYWYTLNRGTPIYITSTTGTINSTEWGILPDGSVEIIFYANDSTGNENSVPVDVHKDTIIPAINILSPMNDTYWNFAPTIQVMALDVNLEEVWYIVGETKIILTNGVSEPLAPSIWNALPNEGPFTITFYANDSANNINDTYSLILYKDVSPPNVIINTPNLYDLFGNKAPNYDVSINEINLQDTWYFLYNGTITSQNISFVYSIDTIITESIWDNFGNGTVTIVFYANDSAGNYGYDSVIVRKDIILPYISINSPNSNQLFSHISPNYNVRFSDINGIDTSWYSLNDGINTVFTSNGSISQTLWENLDNGSVLIKFYANDSVGNVGYNSIFVRKDILPPVINIYEPNPYDQYGTNPPDSNVEFIDGNLYATWYQLIGTSTTDNYTWTGTIENYLWDQMGNGLIVIQFYANDSLGNLGSNSVIVRKDTEAPDVTINSPENDELYGFIPPIVNVDFGPDISNKWYQLIGTITTANYSWAGSIEQNTWDEVGNGTVIVFIYANDSLGNIGYDSVRIEKDILGPNIIIDEPLPNSLFGSNAPLVNLDTNEGNLDQTWYQLIGTITTNNYTWTGVIAQSLWDQMDNGSVTVIFYANDTIGNFGSESIVIRKDNIAPQITINQPDPYSLFGTSPPGVNVEFFDPHLSSTWYHLSNGTVSTNNYTYVEVIDQIAWDQVGNGTVNIIFFANDTLGNLNSDMVIVRKDVIKPDITINNPNMYELCGKTPPIVNLIITDQHLEAVWYQLHNGTISTDNHSWMDAIDQIIWDQIGNGTVDIIFYANDSVGNLASKALIVRKDIISPKITIIEPNSMELFGITAPSAVIDVVDPNLNATWYQLTDGVTSDNYTWSGSINQNAWDLFGTGLVTIKFYANDSMGNLGSNSVTVRKDITAPDITINDPNPFELFGISPSDVDLNVQDPNLDSTWYMLFNSTKSTPNNIWTGTIEQSVWDEFMSGVITIRFYANDTLGNIRFSDVTIIKDITSPDIIINSPNPYELSGLTPPDIDINIFDDNLDEMWYQLANGIITTANYTWIGNISQEAWDELGNGTVDIIFYANDTLSNFATKSITIRKDIIAPVIFINNPSNYSVFGTIPPNIEIIVDEPNLDNTWYQIDNGTVITGNYSWIGIMDQSVWDEIGNGTVNIIFYSNDTLANIASETLIVRKDVIAPEITIVYPNQYELFGKLPPVVTADFDDPHLSDKWYQLDNGTLTTLNNTWTGIIEQSVWDQIGNGTTLIIIYANDSLGNLGFKSVSVQKDIVGPKIIINYPNPYDVFGESTPDIDILFDDNNLDTTWYQLKNESITTQNYTWTGNLEQIVWDKVGNGTVTIFFYANDSMSNFGSSEITIIKDLSAPIISTIEPEDYAVFGNNAPDFKIYISGTDIHNCWYVLLGYPDKHFFTKTDGITFITIDQIAWDQFGNGTVTIEFHVNDSVGNDGFDIIELRKDMFAPDIKINLPIHEGYHSDPPTLNISYFDPNPESLWYKIGLFYGNLINNTEQTIDPLIWNSLEQGEHQLFIFANDSAGNVNDTYVYTIYKDTLAPLITINSPVNGSYSNTPPILNINFYDPNYDSLWYGDGTTNITLVNNTDQSLDWGMWNALPDGLYQIFVYANDTFGHHNNSITIYLYKDTTAPIITINSPTNNTYYNNPPTLDIITSDPNFDTLWYRFGSTEIKITQIFQEFDTTIWNSLDQGEFQVEIFANDTFEHVNSDLTLTLYKDTLPPKIIINSPLNQTYWNSRPILNITAFDPNLESIYYTVSIYSFSLNNNTQELLSSMIWGFLGEGEFNIQFFAEDTFGYINDIYTLTLFKDTIEPNITIEYPLTNALYGKNPPNFSISVSKFNLDSVWYRLMGYPESFILTEYSGTISQTAWDYFRDEPVIIRFYANDTTGNINIQDITVRKDTTAPLIIVNQPIDGTVWDSPPIIKVSVTDSNLDDIWYRIGMMYSSLGNNIEQELDSFIWENLPEGEFHLYISANDSIGNINDSYYLKLYKDTLAPNITINLPIQNQEVEETAPQYDLTIIEDNLDTRWYTLDEGLTNITYASNVGQIDQQIWDEIWESNADDSLITIRFYANDTLNHLGYEDVTIKIKKSGIFELNNPTMLYTGGILIGVLGTATITTKRTKKYKRMDQTQKKKLNYVLYLSLLLSGLLLFTSII
ncbi:MAG: beta strand repeat-containing protein [Promethearchaeota archaeon]